MAAMLDLMQSEIATFDPAATKTPIS